MINGVTGGLQIPL